MAERSVVVASSPASTHTGARAAYKTAQVKKVVIRAHTEEKPFEDFQILPPRKPAERKEPVPGEWCSKGLSERRVCQTNPLSCVYSLLHNVPVIPQCSTISYIILGQCHLSSNTQLLILSMAGCVDPKVLKCPAIESY